MRVRLMVLSALACVALGSLGLASVASAAPPEAPMELHASARSMGLSVALNWSPSPGASRYRIYRSESSFGDVSDAEIVGETDATSFDDQSGVRDGSWWYAVTALQGGEESAPSNVVAAQTSGELDGLYSRSVDWLVGQQERAQGFRITFDQSYPADYAGRLSGQVEEPTSLQGERRAYPFVSFASDYAPDYVGPVQGQWKNVDNPDAYEVQVFSSTDADYLQGTYALQSDGTWSSGDEVAHAGEKSARLVRRSDQLVVAVSGGPELVVGDVVVRVFSRTDADYLQEEIPLGADGRWITTKPTWPGEKIARVVNTTTGRVLNSTEWSDAPSFAGLVRSFSIPQNNPDYGYEGDDTHRSGYRLEQRSFVYDDAIAVLGFLGAERYGRARAILTQLAELQNDDGSLPFSVDNYLGRIADDYRRTGALAWVGYAAVQYELQTGSDDFRSLAEGIARYLETLQVTAANGYSADDPRYGSLLGGRGRYDEAYTYIDTPITWASTEHNIDGYFFFRDLGYATGNADYARVADGIKQSLLTHHWDAAHQRFYQGVDTTGPDSGRALDLSSWGGLFLLAAGETDKARAAAATLSDFRVDGLTIDQSSDPNAFNQTYTSGGPLNGYKPYAQSAGYDDPPELVWAEGTWGALLLRLRLGEDISDDLASMQRLQAADPQGGFVQTTHGDRNLPYEFHVWPAVGGTAWAAIVTGDPTLLWAADGWPDQDQPGTDEPATTTASTSSTNSAQTSSADEQFSTDNLQSTTTAEPLATSASPPPGVTDLNQDDYGPSLRGSASAASVSPNWSCTAFVSNAWRTGLDINVWSFQSCSPEPGYTSVRTCVQIKKGWIFHWWRNLNCQRKNTSTDTGFVEIEPFAECRRGTHKYRGHMDLYAYPPAGEDQVASLHQFKTKC